MRFQLCSVPFTSEMGNLLGTLGYLFIFVVISKYMTVCGLGFTQAFASQYVYCRKKLGLDPEKINVNGGAMALGHPLGATGILHLKSLLHDYICLMSLKSTTPSALLSIIQSKRSS